MTLTPNPPYQQKSSDFDRSHKSSWPWLGRSQPWNPWPALLLVKLGGNFHRGSKTCNTFYIVSQKIVSTFKMSVILSNLNRF